MTGPRTCESCGVGYPQYLAEVMFRSDSPRTDISMRRSLICRACKQDRTDERKRRDRWPAKARDTVRRHAVRLGIPKDELVDRYGWDPATIAHQGKHRYENGCDHCEESYTEMGNGLYDITLDIIDPERAPIFGVNTRWICQTCNRQKGNTDPETFALIKQGYKFRRQQVEAMRADPQEHGRLFWPDRVVSHSQEGMFG